MPSSSGSGSLTRLLMPEDADTNIFQNVGNCMLLAQCCVPEDLNFSNTTVRMSNLAFSE